jgi:hypothetical protein
MAHGKRCSIRNGREVGPTAIWIVELRRVWRIPAILDQYPHCQRTMMDGSEFTRITPGKPALRPVMSATTECASRRREQNGMAK